MMIIAKQGHQMDRHALLAGLKTLLVRTYGQSERRALTGAIELLEASFEGLGAAAVLEDVDEIHPVDGYWVHGVDAEHFGRVSHPTLKEAIAEGRILYGGHPFWTGRVERPAAQDFAPDASHIINSLADSASQLLGGDKPDYTALPESVSVDLRDHLGGAIAAWADKWQLHPRFFHVIDLERHVPNVLLDRE